MLTAAVLLGACTSQKPSEKSWDAALNEVLADAAPVEFAGSQPPHKLRFVFNSLAAPVDSYRADFCWARPDDPKATENNSDWDTFQDLLLREGVGLWPFDFDNRDGLRVVSVRVDLRSGNLSTQAAEASARKVARLIHDHNPCAK